MVKKHGIHAKSYIFVKIQKVLIENIKNIWLLIKDKTPKPIKNFYVLSLILFAIWMLVFDQDRVLVQAKKVSVNQELKREVKYYQDKIKKSNEELSGLMNDPEKLVKLAREKYYMHKKTEDVYVIEEVKKGK